MNLYSPFSCYAIKQRLGKSAVSYNQLYENCFPDPTGLPRWSMVMFYIAILAFQCHGHGIERRDLLLIRGPDPENVLNPWKVGIGPTCSGRLRI